jgi:hypothetical protein
MYVSGAFNNLWPAKGLATAGHELSGSEALNPTAKYFLVFSISTPKKY